MASLLLRLSVPFVAVMFVAASILVANVVDTLIETRQRAKLLDNSDLDTEDLPLVSTSTPSEVTPVNFPALALFTSVSLSIAKFFYFGTAMAAHQYLFATAQRYTGIDYVQNKPWMRYSDAISLIVVSIPSLLIFDFALPIAFVVTCWKVRRSFYLPGVQMYFGTLFETFNLRCFWWELVNIIKKLAIALTLQGVPASDSGQSAIIVSILAGTLAAQVTLMPWRRKLSENLADTLSALLLILALFFTRPYQGTHSLEVQYYVLASSVVFVLGSLAFIVFHAVTDTTTYELQLARHMSQTKLGLQQLGVNGSLESGWHETNVKEQFMSEEEEVEPSPLE